MSTGKKKATPRRPAFKPTQQHRAFVSAMVESGAKQDRIAEALDIDAKTLREHFRAELGVGSAGRPPFVPTDEQRMFVRAMVLNGEKQERIAEVVGGGIDPKTLREHFRAELDLSKSRNDALVTANLLRQALKNHPSALGAIKWYQTAFMGKGERKDVNHSGAVTQLQLDPATLEGMTNDELAALQRAIGKLGGSAGDGVGGNASEADPADYIPT